MVKVFILLLLAVSVNSFSDERRFSPEKLREMNRGNAVSKSEAIARFKSRKGTNKYINNKKVTYRMPSGKYVHGIVLPNGKVSPAIKKDGESYPACVLNNGSFVQGVFNSKLDSIVCDIPYQELSMIDDNLNFSVTKKEDGHEKTKDTKISKYKNDGSSNKKVIISSIKKKDDIATIKAKAPVNKNIYKRPPFSHSKSNTKSQVIDTGVKPYGIKIGTWAEIELLRNVTNADSDLVEFTMNTALNGKYRSLPAGTILFGRKRFNSQNKRLEVLINLALTPDDIEIDTINAWVYAPDKTAGLHGVIERDREGESEAAASNAALMGVSAIAAPIGSTGEVAGAIAKSYTGDMIKNERAYLPKNPTAVIRVSPQLALIKISKSF